MNWGRGFFRLRVAFSALWFCGVSLSAYESWAALNSGNDLREETEESQRLTELNCSDPKAREMLTIEECRELVELSSNHVEHPRAIQERQKSIIFDHAKWGLGGVFGTYLIGAAIGWILSGFHQKRTAVTAAGAVEPPAKSK